MGDLYSNVDQRATSVKEWFRESVSDKVTHGSCSYFSGPVSRGAQRGLWGRGRNWGQDSTLWAPLHEPGLRGEQGWADSMTGGVCHSAFPGQCRRGPGRHSQVTLGRLHGNLGTSNYADRQTRSRQCQEARTPLETWSLRQAQFFRPGWEILKLSSRGVGAPGRKPESGTTVFLVAPETLALMLTPKQPV